VVDRRPSRSHRVRSRAIPALALLLCAAGTAAVVGVMVGMEERGAAAKRGARVSARVPDVIRETPQRDPAAAASPRRAAQRSRPRIEWRRSAAIGMPEAGRLERGVKLPYGGRSYFTWDPIQKESPNRGWRRWGTDRLVRTTLRVVREFAAAHPRAPRVGIGDLSRPHGGDFGPAYGLPGHASHQNGLDVDLYYPRLDGTERAPLGPDQIDRSLSQDLVHGFVRAGAEVIFVGPNTGLVGPPGVVVPLVNHDNHLHVRLPG
jgi:Penicillin-insensitive murein endopeptidase